LVGGFPSSIAAGSTASFTVQLASTVVGSQFGQITFQTNDPNAPTFGFNVSGTVTGTPPAGAPQVTLSRAAVEIDFASIPRVLDTGVALTDSSSGFTGGRVTVAMASGATANDRLSILNQGTGPGQIGFNGSNVTYGGTVIGTASIAPNPASL